MKKKSPKSVRLHPAVEEALIKKANTLNKSVNALINEIIKKYVTNS